MPKFFVSQDQINDDEIEINGADVNHIINVLRMKESDRVNICDINSKNNYTAEIITYNNESIKCRIVEKKDSKGESNIYITLFQGLPKGDKMELIIEKNVELGIYEVAPVFMERSISKVDEKTKVKKQQKWQKISETAAKQSGRDIIPKVNDIINIKNICNLINSYDIVLLAYEEETKNTLKEELKRLDSKKDIKIGIIVGPEGGLSKEEVNMLKEYGAKVVTLGKRILRTETAGVALTSIIMYELDAWEDI